MNLKMIFKILTDIAMTAALLLLMAYKLVGGETHEWIGVAMFMLFILHHILNSHWSRNLFKGRYTVMRTLQTMLVILVLLSMIGAMFSGIVLSHHIFSFLPVQGLHSFAHTMHRFTAYWGFVLMSLHLGFHWNNMIGMAEKLVKRPSVICVWIFRAVAMLIAGYGVHAFIHRRIGCYLLMLEPSVRFRFHEQLGSFAADYIAIMGLFVYAGYYLFDTIKHSSCHTE